MHASRLIVVTLGLATSGLASAGIISQSQGALTAGLGVSPANAWNGVGQVGAIRNGQQNFFCSGTLIDRPAGAPAQTTGRWVLTAAHCTEDSPANYDQAGVPMIPYPGPSYPPSYLPVPPRDPYPYPPNDPNAPPFLSFLGNGYANDSMLFSLPTEGAGPYRSKMVFRHPNWQAGNSNYDVAVILLDDNTNSTTYPINVNQINELGKTGTKVGYGLGGDGVNGEWTPYGVKRQGRNVVDMLAGGANNDELLKFDFDNHALLAGMANFTGPLGGAALGVDEYNSTHGDSGGPMFMQDAGGMWRIVGVTRGGDDPRAKFLDISNDARVRLAAPWINTLPEPATMGLLLLGLAPRLMRRRR